MMELILPNNYVEIKEEEMMYLDGGVYLSKATCMGIAVYFGSGQGMIAAAGTAAAAKKLVKVIGKWSSIAGYIASLALSYAFVQLGSLLWNIGTAVIKKKGVDIGWSWNPFDFGLDYRIR